MTTILPHISPRRRPAILVQAAKYCARDYRRGRVVARLVNGAGTPLKTVVIDALRAEEDRIEASRKLADHAYNARQHVQVLAALIAEQRGVTD